MRNASFPALIDTCGTDTDSLSHSIPEYFLQADNEEAMKDWVKDIEETSVTVVPVLGHGGTGGDSGAAPVAARKVSYIEDRELPVSFPLSRWLSQCTPRAAMRDHSAVV